MYVLDYLRSRSVNFQAILHCPASSATRLAGCLHIPGERVAKTVLMRAGESHVLAVLPATSRLDLTRLGHLLRLDPREVKLAGEADICRIFHDCEPGAMPPFGALYQLRTVADIRLQGAGEIVLSTNLRHLGVRLKFEDFARLEDAIRGEFSEPATQGQALSTPRPHRRRAG